MFSGNHILELCMANSEGFGKGRTDPVYQVDGEEIPLLSKFYFGFDKGGAGGRQVDNHLNSLMVIPGGESEDASPNADLPVTNVPEGRIALICQDDDADDPKDRYFYKVAHEVESGAIDRFSIRDVGCVGKCERTLPFPQGMPSIDRGIFALVGFKLFYTGGRDHHVDEIAVFEEDGELTVKFNDRNDDDTFGYEVQYTWISPVGQNVHLGEASGLATGAERRLLPEGVKVIRGFEFDFSSDDNHLREIGVLTSQDNLEVYYGDKGGDDQFRWNVRWATVEPMVVGPGSI